MTIKKLIIGILLIGIIIMLPGYGVLRDVMAAKMKNFVLVIDAGHGGPDSGAVAADGTEEKNLNLEIAKAVEEEAKKYDIKVVMTRTEDVGLYKDGAIGGTWSKMEDIYARKKIMDESNANLILMIHLNSFKADSRVRGAQVFYPKLCEEQMYESNKKLAHSIQESLKTGIPDGSDRVPLPKGDVYLLKNVNKPIILVECGFLSNENDLNNLKDSKFQQKIAVYIINGIAKNYSLNILKK